MNNLDYDNTVDVDKLEDFPHDDDSTIFVREQQKKGKLAGLFKKKRGKVTSEAKHAIKFIPDGKTEEVTLSKREIARALKAERKQKVSRRAKQYALKDIDNRKAEETAQIFAELEQEETAQEGKKADNPKPARTGRSRGARDRYGLPVYVSGVGKKKTGQK